jgi:hypothetical protein
MTAWISSFEALSPLIKPTSLRAKISEFLVAGTEGAGAPVYVWALVPPSGVSAKAHGTRSRSMSGSRNARVSAVIVVRSAADVAAAEEGLREPYKTWKRPARG